MLCLRDHLSINAYELYARQAAAEQVANKHDQLTLLVNAAGILHIPGVLSPGESASVCCP